MALDPNLDVRLTGHDVDCLTEVLEYIEGRSGSYSDKVQHCLVMLRLRAATAERNYRAIEALLGPKAAQILSEMKHGQ